MAALTKDRNTRTRAQGSMRSGIGKVATNTVIYHGSLIAKNAGGFIVPASDTAALKVVGIAQGQVNNNPGANGAKEVTYITGVEVELENAGGAIVQAGDKTTCCVADDQSVTSAAVAVNDVLAGIVREFTTTKVWVFVDEMLGAAT